MKDICELVVCGSRGTYEINPLERPIRASAAIADSETRYSKSYTSEREELPIATVPGDSRYDELMLDFASMVRGEKQNPYNYEYEFQLQRMILACCGRKVDFRREVIL